MSQDRYLDNFHERLQDAYGAFKGGCETTIQSTRMLEVVETARTNGVERSDGQIVDAVHVYLKDGNEEIPEVVQKVAGKHKLVEVKREHRYGSDNIEYVSYIREELSVEE